MGAAVAPPGPSIYVNCGGLDAYKRHIAERTVTCAPCRESARLGEAAYRKYRYLHGPRKVCAIGTRRRVRALVAVGWTMTDLAARLDPPTSDHALQKVVGREVVYREKAAQVAELYDRLWDTAPPEDGGKAVKSRRRAAKLGWLPPMAWDDERMDDPGYVPLEQVLRDWEQALVMARDWERNARRRTSRAVRTAEQAEQDRARKREWQQQRRRQGREQEEDRAA